MSEDNPEQRYRGRLAPTPSGYLHEGHIQTFRTAWMRASDNKGEVIFRMDDLDSNRCTSEYKTACVEDMKKMGLDWHEGPDVGGNDGPYEQSKRSDFYKGMLKKLFEMGCIYPCTKTRKEIRSAGVLDSFSLEFLYPESFRPLDADDSDQEFRFDINWRFRTNWGDHVRFTDIKKAEQSFLVGTDMSDFLVWRKEGVASYELATVVDDYLMRITEIVRGEDLLLSSARQCLLFDVFGWNRPAFFHCELLLGEDGKKLSKSSRLLPRLFSAS